MNKKDIGLGAGVVWRLLSDGKSRTLEQIAIEAQLPMDVLCAAIGWLAREDKIEIDESGDGKPVTFRLQLVPYF